MDASPPIDPDSDRLDEETLRRIQEEQEEAIRFLTMNENLKPIERLEQMLSSYVPVQRYVGFRDIMDTVEGFNLSEMESVVIARLGYLSRDPEHLVRETVAAKLLDVAKFIVKLNPEQGYRHLITSFVPALVILVQDPNVQVQRSAVDSLAEIAMYLQTADIQNFIIEGFVHEFKLDQRFEEVRSLGAVVLGHFSKVLPEPFIKNAIFSDLEELGRDRAFTVRGSVVVTLAQIAEYISVELAEEKLIPLFQTLCRDRIWGVRRACADVMDELFKFSSPKVRDEILLPAAFTLLDDENNWVQRASIRSLGALICAFDPTGPRNSFAEPEPAGSSEIRKNPKRVGVRSRVPEKLVEVFVKLAFSTPSTKFVSHETGEHLSFDAEDVEICAYSLPGVVQTIGPERWGEVRGAFNKMSNDSRWRVRRPLSCALHEYARILDTEICESELLPAFEFFLMDLDEVKIGALRNMALFFKYVSPNKRSAVLKVIHEMVSNKSGWRIRKISARQLLELSELFPGHIVVSHLLPLLLTLCEDDAARVRKAAYKTLAYYVERLANSPGVLMDALQRVCQAATSEKARGRIGFVHLCETCAPVLSPEIVVDCFGPLFMQLAVDPIPNVRLNLGKALVTTFRKHTVLVTMPFFQQLLDILQRDKDRDTRYFAGLASGMSEEEVEALMNLKTDEEESLIGQAMRMNLDIEKAGDSENAMGVDSMESPSLSSQNSIPPTMFEMEDIDKG